MNVVSMLEQYARETTAFCWGSHDCVLWCARWLDRRTGRDFFEKDVLRRFHYRNAKQALRIVRKHGGYLPLVQEYLGEVGPPLLLSVGSIALVSVVRREGLGIVAPHQVLVLGPEGVAALPLQFARGGWPCPSS